MKDTSVTVLKSKAFLLTAHRMPTLEQYRAAMVLSAVGDALGYKNGDWEFNLSGKHIHEQLKKSGGLGPLSIQGWIVSDDTVLHLATAEALVSAWTTHEELFQRIALNYKNSRVC